LLSAAPIVLKVVTIWVELCRHVELVRAARAVLQNRGCVPLVFPMLLVNGHFAPGPTACQLMGSVVELVDQVVDVVLGAMLSYVLVVA
jgi:hypothetical protein